jgi:TatD DNase family protein
VQRLCELGSISHVLALGETGLDYYHPHDAAGMERQKNCFRNHIRAAILLNKPLIIHTRAAALDTLTILQEENAEKVGGVFHCFTEDWATAKAAVDLNFYISFSGIITFKNAELLREVARLLPIDRILIETDSPYLAPVPFRGKTNQPAYVKYVAEAMAAVKGLAFEEVAKKTSSNYSNLFKVNLA